jgi:N-acyl-L-homoserine lactone synthetase
MTVLAVNDNSRLHDILEVGSNSRGARMLDATNPVDVLAYEQLRYGYFIKCKRWADHGKCPGHESDHFDPYCHHLGVFEQEHLAAYLRVLPTTWPCGLMLDHDFRCLLTDEKHRSIIRENSVELSRLVIAPDEAEPHPHRRNRQIIELLLKLLYHLSLQEGYLHFYIEVETSWLKPFARRFGLPFTPICDPYTFPDGTETVAAYASLQDLEQAVRSRSPEKYEWYRQP